MTMREYDRVSCVVDAGLIVIEVSLSVPDVAVINGEESFVLEYVFRRNEMLVKLTVEEMVKMGDVEIFETYFDT